MFKVVSGLALNDDVEAADATFNDYLLENYLGAQAAMRATQATYAGGADGVVDGVGELNTSSAGVDTALSRRRVERSLS